MSIVVQKFGGTSVANAERIMAAARRAIRAKQAGASVVVVVSARGDTTDDLIQLAHEISESPPAREMDMLLATGEQISIALLAMAITELGEAAISFTGAQIGIFTDSSHTKARIQRIDTTRIRAALAIGQIVIVAGFQGIDEQRNITTLGRGGSDTTAVALAAALKHDPAAPSEHDRDVDCEIYTDVDGIYTTDPRLVPEARKMDAISYDEMLELASLGAGVMHSRAIEFGRKFDVPLMVRSSFSDALGTWIVPEAAWMDQVQVCGVALARDEARLLVDGVPDRPGISYQIFRELSRVHIAVDMIAQSQGTGGVASIGFTVPRDELSLAVATLQPIVEEMGGSLRTVEDVSKVSAVGTGMRSHTGVAERMFRALSDAEVNIKMITTGDIKISVLVDKIDGVRALKALHTAFALDAERIGAGRTEPEELDSLKPIPTPRVDAEAAGDVVRLAQILTDMESVVVSGVELQPDHGRVTIHDLTDRPGYCAAVFDAIAAGDVMVDMIIQNMTSPGSAELSFSVPEGDLEPALKLTRDVVAQLDSKARVVGDANSVALFVYGVGMRTHTGVAEKMFGTLAERGINIRLINTSEVCVSVVVNEEHGSTSLAALRECFGVE